MLVHTVLVLQIFLAINCVLVHGDPPITPNERAAIKKFRPTVEHLLPHDYMKADTWLLRWIRAKKLDLSDAKDMLIRALEWRKVHKIDEVTEKSLQTQFSKEFPVLLPGVDKEGRPYYIDNWTGDIRKVVLAGKRNDYLQFKRAQFELVERKVRELNVHNNNTEWIGIYDFNKFTSATHLCVACLPIYLDHSSTYEFYFPLGANKFFVTNAPRIFQTVLRLIAPIIGNTINRITVFPSDNSYKEKLLEVFPADQLPIQYGGTLKI